MDSQLRAADIALRYRKTGFTLEVGELEMAPGMNFLVGLNGSGKSTLIKVLSGVVRPQHGQVLFRGASIRGRSSFADYCRNSGYLWQNFSLSGSTSTLDYLAYRAWLYGMSVADARRAATKSVERIELAEVGDTPVGKLSGGMSRRVGIAAATLHGPGVLLLDEPSSGLDYKARDLVSSAIRVMAEDHMTIVCAEHEPGEMACYDATYHVMSRGRLTATRHVPAGRLTDSLFRDMLEGRQ